jgi:localization factor PodJL
MLARVSRSETEAQNAYKGLDQQLKTVARRLEAAERNQTENNRAMTQAATQINIAAREQAQAFEQMTSNVGALAERLVRVERHAQADNTREAVKALHEGLSRVADQIAQTASQSAAQIAALADNMESIATQLAETRQAADATAQATDATAHTVEIRFASLDERLRVVERSAFSSASALDHTMENVEALRAMKDSVEAELREYSTALSQVQESFEQFSAHSSIEQNRRAGAIANLEERLSELQTQHAENPLDLRLQGIEHVLSDMMTRMEQSERTGTAISAAAVGVGARLSAAKSISVTSVSCPTAEISGIMLAAAARTTLSSLKDHKSSSEPPPRATINRSGLGIGPPATIALKP